MDIAASRLTARDLARPRRARKRARGKPALGGRELRE
jgi:hypothetical protein